MTDGEAPARSTARNYIFGDLRRELVREAESYDAKVAIKGTRGLLLYQSDHVPRKVRELARPLEMNRPLVTAYLLKRELALAWEGRLGRNSAMNLAAQAAQAIATVISVPALIHFLGVERVGILALVWAITGYFSVLDLGIGRAVTHSMARLLAKSENAIIPEVFWSAVGFQLIIGVVGASALMISIPLLTRHLINIPPKLLPEATTTILICASSLPIILVSSSFVGLLQGAHRFDVTNIITGTGAVLAQLLPVAIAAYAPNLPNAVLAITAVRFLSCLLLAICSNRVFPGLMRAIRINTSALFDLLKYGGWVSVSSLIAPVMINADKLMIGSLLSMYLVTCYVAPFEAGSRLTVISTSLATALFPLLAGAGAKRDLAQSVPVLLKAVWILLTLVGFLAAIAFLVSDSIMAIWLGPKIAAYSAPVLGLVVVGALINSLASVPYCAIQAFGRPDVTAKLHLLELPINLAVLWVAILEWRIKGAAMAYVFRVSFDLVLLCWALIRIGGEYVRNTVAKELLLGASLFAAEICALTGIRHLGHRSTVTYSIGITVAACFALFNAKKFLRVEEAGNPGSRSRRG